MFSWFAKSCEESLAELLISCNFFDGKVLISLDINVKKTVWNAPKWTQNKPEFLSIFAQKYVANEMRVPLIMPTFVFEQKGIKISRIF